MSVASHDKGLFMAHANLTGDRQPSWSLGLHARGEEWSARELHIVSSGSGTWYFCLLLELASWPCTLQGGLEIRKSTWIFGE